MNKFYFFLSVAAMSAAIPCAGKEQVLFSSDYPIVSVSGANHEKATVTPTADADGIITTAPAGDLVNYTRDAEGFLLTNKGVAAQVSTKGTWAVYAEDGSVYIYNPYSTISTGSYMKGKKDGSRVKVQLPQHIADEDVDGVIEHYFVYKLELYVTSDGRYTYIPAENQEVEYVYDGENFVLDMENTNTDASLPPSTILGLADEDGAWLGFGDYKQSYVVFNETPVVAPENLETENWAFTYTGNGRPVEIGFENGNVWVKGVSASLPDAWIKGTVGNDGKVVFESSQYLGIDPVSSYHSYFMGAHIELLFNEQYQDYLYTPVLDDNLTMEYDSENHTMTSGENASLLINARKDRLFVIEQYDSPAFKKDGDVSNFTPGAASLVEFVYDSMFGVSCLGFNLPSTNTAGQQLDSGNMYYCIYVNGELFTFTRAEYMLSKDMTDLPYNFTNPSMDIYAEGELHYIYIYDKFESIGVRSYYLNGDEKVWSDMFEYDVATGTVTGIGQIESSADIVSEVYYTLSGVRVDEPRNGMFIRSVTYSDGRVKSEKVIVK